MRAKVSLGHIESIAKECILEGDPDKKEVFSVALAKFDHALAKTLLDPHKDRHSDVNYYRFYLGSYIAYIKVDEKPTPMPLSLFSMALNKPLYIICRDFTKSKELELMRKLVGG